MGTSSTTGRSGPGSGPEVSVCGVPGVRRRNWPQNQTGKIDAEVADLTEDEAAREQERLQRKWASVEALVGSEKRLTARALP
jgi:hypothetical protein